MFSRRTFLKHAAAASCAMASCARPARSGIPGKIMGASAELGHRMRDGGFPKPSRKEATRVAIVGGGVAGLAAARWLRRKGVADFVVLDLERTPGGNAASGGNEISRYPWGAHYIPVPNEESAEVREFLEECGLITGYDSASTPIFDELALVQDPVERLFLHGRWQDGLLPQLGISTEDRAQYNSFFRKMDEWRAAVGTDGRRAFAIPVDRSSQDPEILALDAITMDRYLDQHGWNSAPLRWHVNYCCRDDYGAGSSQVSAWAGIHYFASRNGRAANAPKEALLTWPQGNGYLVERLLERSEAHTRLACVAWRIEPESGRARVSYYDVERRESVELAAERVICAAPRFVAQHLIPGLQPASGVYSPWVVSNISLEAFSECLCEPVCWDNVIRESDSLGYVVATHQKLETHSVRTVLTHYWPLDSAAPADARRAALTKTHSEWVEQIVADLEIAHPGIRRSISRIDVWIWGHGMIRPVPNYIWGGARRGMREPAGPIHFAHSDMSGISIFEEAYTHGVNAARAVMESLT